MLEAFDWSVVVLGRWNRSILTPAGIARRLFKLEEKVPLKVEIALDVMLPPMVTHNSLRVTPGSQQLIIEPLTHTYTHLNEARTLAINALKDLPETPVTAVGVNVRYAYKTVDERMASVQDIISCDLDTKISSLERTLIKRSVSRSIPIFDGHLNLNVSEDDKEESIFIHFNFEFISQETIKQREWLTLSIDDFRKEVRLMLTKTLDFNEENIPDD